jgi:hypothetical protein
MRVGTRALADSVAKQSNYQRAEQARRKSKEWFELEAGSDGYIQLATMVGA